MHRIPPLQALGLSVAASVATAILCVLALGETLAAGGPDPAVQVELAALDQRVASLAERLGEQPADPAATASLERELGALRARLDEIEASARREAVSGEIPRAADGEDAGRAAEPSAAEAEADRGARRRPKREPLGREEFAALIGSVLVGGGDVSPEEEARFWETARSTGYVDDLLEELGDRVEADPGDLEARLELADAYVAKLLTVPAGPERGVWGMRAEEQWREVLAADPGSWDAQFRLAESLSYYPEFLGKTGEAIEGLERAREIQQGLAPEPRHARTYVLLSRLYARDGRPEEARRVLRDGLALHQGHDELEEALASLEGQ